MLGVELRELATRLSHAAGELIETMRGDIDLSGDTKSSATDVVTAADKASEQLIIDGILANRPHDGVLGEEGGDIVGSSGVRWLVDPIDGTTNYVYNLPAYCVSIAAELDGEVIAGVVFEPKARTTFDAVRGAGARRNGSPIRVNRLTDLQLALVSTGFGYRPERRAAQGAVVTALLPDIRDIRRFGSAALDLCAVAEGAVDAYFEKGLNPWDFAAGSLICTEAGATVGDLRGGEHSETFLLAGNPDLFAALRDRLVDLGADDGRWLSGQRGLQRLRRPPDGG